MKTFLYNPSKIEKEFTQVVLELREEIQKKLSLYKIEEIKNNINEDNPTLIFKLKDKDGDKHELVVKFIQRLEE
jgi:hypothetical protein